MIYKIDKSVISDNITSFKSWGTLFYPLKANDSIDILKIINSNFSNEDGYLVSSLSHCEKLIGIGISPDRLIYIDVFSDLALKDKFYSLGVRSFVFASYNSLVDFYSLHKDISIYLRLSTDSFYCNYFKLTVSLGADLADFNKVMEFCDSEGKDLNLQVYFSRDSLENHTEELNCLSKYINSLNYTFKSINIGGLRNDLMCKSEHMFPCDVVYEIGERLLDCSADCYTSVLHKTDKSLFINHSIYWGMLDSCLYAKRWKIKVGGTVLSKQRTSVYSKKILVYGGSCDSKDNLGVYWVNPNRFAEIKIDDEVIIYNVNSYFNVFNIPSYMFRDEVKVEIV